MYAFRLNFDFLEKGIYFEYKSSG